VLGEEAQLAAQRLVRLLADRVGCQVVEGELERVEPGSVEGPDPLAGEEVAVGVHRWRQATGAHVADHLDQVGVEQGLAAGQGHEHRAQLGQAIDPRLERGQRHRRRGRIELGAVAARQVAAAGDDQVRHERPVGIDRGGGEASEHAQIGPELAAAAMAGSDGGEGGVGHARPRLRPPGPASNRPRSRHGPAQVRPISGRSRPGLTSP
jgi:hypothetical protein